MQSPTTSNTSTSRSVTGTACPFTAANNTREREREREIYMLPSYDENGHVVTPATWSCSARRSLSPPQLYLCWRSKRLRVVLRYIRCYSGSSSLSCQLWILVRKVEAVSAEVSVSCRQRPCPCGTSVQSSTQELLSVLLGGTETPTTRLGVLAHAFFCETVWLQVRTACSTICPVGALLLYSKMRLPVVTSLQHAPQSHCKLLRIVTCYSS